MTAVLIDQAARREMERVAVRYRLRETGGSVFGWRQDDRVVAACVSGPGPKARHRMRSFEPTRATTAAAIDAVLTASDGRYGYLGSWHTHPRGVAVPSAIDRSTAAGMAAQDDLRLPLPLLLILATAGNAKNIRPAMLAAWTWDAATATLVAAPIETCSLPDVRCPQKAAVFLDVGLLVK